MYLVIREEDNILHLCHDEAELLDYLYDYDDLDGSRVYMVGEEVKLGSHYELFHFVQGEPVSLGEFDDKEEVINLMWDMAEEEMEHFPFPVARQPIANALTLRSGNHIVAHYWIETTPFIVDPGPYRFLTATGKPERKRLSPAQRETFSY